MAASSAEPRSRTAKGEREAERMLGAATVVLARDGFGGATIGRIGAEAGVDKRMVLYYFGTREALLAEVVRRLGERVAANVAAAVAELDVPEAVTSAGIDALWTGGIEEPELPRAYMALLTSSGESPEVQAALTALKRVFEQLFAERVDALEARGFELLEDRDAFVKFMFAVLRGLVLEWAEEGPSEALDRSLEQFKRLALSRFRADP